MSINICNSSLYLQAQTNFWAHLTTYVQANFKYKIKNHMGKFETSSKLLYFNTNIAVSTERLHLLYTFVIY